MLGLWRCALLLLFFPPPFLLILFSKLSIGFLLISVLFKFWKLFLLFSEDYVFVTAKVALWVC